ncbi:MAG: sulfurtransferase [Saprospiraceae bacterium]|nr:sulfurtransferase [Saprospiraceae bacterium]
MYQTIISVSELQRNLQNPSWNILDCRFNLADTDQGLREYHAGHIPRSHYAHLDEDLSSVVIPGVTGRHPLPELEIFAIRLRKWGITNQSQVVAYDGGNGGIAARLWWMLRWLGHDAVAVLNGGWSAWVASGAPQTVEISPVQYGSFQPDLRSDLAIDRKEVENVLGNKEWIVVDARAEERYLGLVEPIDPVAGHIDGAINHPFTSNLTAEGVWKSPEELKSELDLKCKNHKANHTVFYCGSGVTACHNVLAYKHAGLGDARLYPGSWSEWINKLQD